MLTAMHNAIFISVNLVVYSYKNIIYIFYCYMLDNVTSCHTNKIYSWCMMVYVNCCKCNTLDKSVMNNFTIYIYYMCVYCSLYNCQAMPILLCGWRFIKAKNRGIERWNNMYECVNEIVKSTHLPFDHNISINCLSLSYTIRIRYIYTYIYRI